MEVQISGKAAEIISAKVASGIYADAEEFITDIVCVRMNLTELNLKSSAVNCSLVSINSIVAKAFPLTPTR